MPRDYEAIMLEQDIKIVKNKMFNGEELSSLDVENIITDGWLLVMEEVEDEDLDRTRTVTLVLKVDDRYFTIEYEHGLTEMQDNEYPAQVAIEVVPEPQVSRFVKYVKKV